MIQEVVALDCGNRDSVQASCTLPRHRVKVCWENPFQSWSWQHPSVVLPMQCRCPVRIPYHRYNVETFSRQRPAISNRFLLRFQADAFVVQCTCRCILLIKHALLSSWYHYPIAFSRTDDCIDIFWFFSQVKELASTQCKRNWVVKFTKMIIDL